MNKVRLVIAIIVSLIVLPNISINTIEAAGTAQNGFYDLKEKNFTPVTDFKKYPMKLKVKTLLGKDQYLVLNGKVQWASNIILLTAKELKEAEINVGDFESAKQVDLSTFKTNVSNDTDTGFDIDKID